MIILLVLNTYDCYATIHGKKMDGFFAWLLLASILGPLLFNVILCDMFLFDENIDLAIYADDNCI